MQKNCQKAVFESAGGLACISVSLLFNAVKVNIVFTETVSSFSSQIAVLSVKNTRKCACRSLLASPKQSVV